jgi:hypothetical protein
MCNGSRLRPRQSRGWSELEPARLQAALGETLRLAQRTAYAAVGRIHFDGMQYRNDIGHRALGARKG